MYFNVEFLFGFRNFYNFQHHVCTIFRIYCCGRVKGNGVLWDVKLLI